MLLPLPKPLRTKPDSSTLHSKVDVEEIEDGEVVEDVSGQKGRLKRHQGLVHEKKKDHICSDCGKPFGRKDSLKQHQELIHWWRLNFSR